MLVAANVRLDAARSQTRSMAARPSWRPSSIAAVHARGDQPPTVAERPGAGQEDEHMGKALLGTHATPGSLRLLDEVRALRARVEELERALAEAESARPAAPDEDAEALRVEEREPAAT